MRRKQSNKRSSVDGDPAPKRRVRSKALAGAEGSGGASAKGRAPKKQATETNRGDDEHEPELDDSDLDSSDLDATLMAVGGRDLEESGLLAQRIRARRQNRKKKKKKRRKKTTRKAALQSSRENCQATPEVRALLSRGQQQFYCGEFADAIETMRAVIREQPGLADPYHVLHQVYTELGEEKKAAPHQLAILESRETQRPERQFTI
ncbi:ACP5 [Symbiodinium sp. CCMP2456]|nr:ACP5 [Symbiodinium sp. CCMP2456]